MWRKRNNLGRTNGVLAKRGLCPLPKTGGFDENGENDEWTLCPQKNKGLRPLKTTKMTKMTKIAGVTHAKTLFAKDPAFAPPTIMKTRKKNATDIKP